MIRDQLLAAVHAALDAAGLPVPEAGVELAPPTDPRQQADFTTNVAMQLAKPLGRPPRDVAAQLVEALDAARAAHVDRAEVAGPGFVNLYLSPTWLYEVLRAVVAQGERYGHGTVFAGERINLEFVSANPTGPIHAGAGRWIAVGDAIANLLAAQGAEVHREYYVNDAGHQLDTFAASLLARVRGEDPPEDGYHGEYLVEMADDLRARLGDGVTLDDARDSHRAIVAGIREELEQIGVHFDTWFSERTLHENGEVEAVLADLGVRGVVYESEGATWLRSTDFGDTRDRVLVRSDGSPTYLLADIAYHRNKFERGWTHLIDIWGADHHGQVKSLQSGMEALGYPAGEPEVLLGQLVKLQRGGELVRLSRRTGTIVTLADILDEVDPDVARLTFLLQGIDTAQTFDLDVVTTQSMDNPVYYVQYAHARIASIGRKAASEGISRLPILDTDLAPLTHEREVELLRALAQYPEVVEEAARLRSPHRVTAWVRDFAKTFHGFYRDCRVLSDDAALTQARLWLAEACRLALASALAILGVHAPDEMTRPDEDDRGLVNDAAPVDLGLLPAGAVVDDAGRLTIGGVELTELADTHGTPLYVYDEDELRARCAAYRTAFGSADGDHAGASYAAKAFLCVAMARLVADAGLDLDVATGGEAHVAHRAGFPPERMVFHGNNKSELELRLALELGVGRLVVDGFDELRRIEELVAAGLPRPRVLLRVAPGVEAHTHEHIATGAEDSKFGFTVSNGAARDAAARAVTGDAMELLGFHCHIGSQILALDPYALAADVLTTLAADVRDATGVMVEELNLGGGLGVAYTADDLAGMPTIADFGAFVRAAFDDACARAALDPVPRLTVEAGRSIAAPAGVTLYRVGTVKTIPGVRTYVAVDGGMSDNPRPATYGARYEAFMPSRVRSERPLVATVAGKHCEQGDLLVRDAHLPGDVEVGDVLATPVTGAYAHSMASNYNLVPRAAVVFVRNGASRVVVRRETYEDLVSRDVPERDKTEA